MGAVLVICGACGGGSGIDDGPTPAPSPAVTAPPGADGERVLADAVRTGDSRVTVELGSVEGPIHLRADCAGLSFLDVSVSGGDVVLSDTWTCTRTSDAADHLVLDLADGTSVEGPVDVSVTVAPYGRRLSEQEQEEAAGQDEESNGFAPAPDDASYAFVLTEG